LLLIRCHGLPTIKSRIGSRVNFAHAPGHGGKDVYYGWGGAISLAFFFLALALSR